ncbi:MAG: uracil phosphoribosyltransferase [Planctomycetota bacterium]
MIWLIVAALAMSFLGALHPVGDSLAVFRVGFCLVLLPCVLALPRGGFARLTLLSITLLGLASVLWHKIPTSDPGPVTIYQKNVLHRRLPTDLNAGPVILVDPMLATGGSAVAAAEILRKAGATDLRLICLVAAPEGVRRLAAEFPAMPIYAAALDRQLDHRGFICPGLGDAGDRLFGTD